MALYKRIISENGIVSYYHVIQQVYLDKDGNLDILVNHYADEHYRKENADNPVGTDFYYGSVGKPSVSFEEAYTVLKSLEIFEGAEDVVEQEVTDESDTND